MHPRSDGSAEQFPLKRLSRKPQVTGYISQNRGQRADAQRRVGRDRDVVFTPNHRGEAKVTTGLPRHPIPVMPSESLRELDAGEVSRQPHTASSSSRTR